MTNPGAHGASIDETARQRFEAARAHGRPEPIAHFLPTEDDPTYLPTLEELVCIELELGWKLLGRAGRWDSSGTFSETEVLPPPVETYLASFPRLNQPDIILRLLQQERFVRRQAGDPAPIEEYRRRFPALAAASEDLESP